MPIYSVVKSMESTGRVKPVPEWEEVDGRRRPSDKQARSEKGIPLWRVGVIYETEQWGEVDDVMNAVEVPAAEMPQVAKRQAVTFKDLTVLVTVSKGQLREIWRAEGIEQSVRGKAE